MTELTRPKSRVPALSPRDAERIARVLYGEARGQTPEERRWIIATILNRIESGRFPDNAAAVLNSGEYDAVPGGSTAMDIQVPYSDKLIDTKNSVSVYEPGLETLMFEVADALKRREDPTGGRTLYKTKETPGEWTGLKTEDHFAHDFFSGYPNQDPVTDVSSRAVNYAPLPEAGLLAYLVQSRLGNVRPKARPDAAGILSQLAPMHSLRPMPRPDR